MSHTPSALLRAESEAIWAAQHAHPFVRGIGDGSLAPERFALWLRQDYRFLIDYARLFGAAVLRAPTLATMTACARLANEILGTEMDLHRAYCGEFGIDLAALEREPRAPTTEGYTNFLLRTATTGDFAELVGALLPCMWGFHEIGTRLATGGPSPEPRDQAWIAMYAGEEFGALARWCIALLDEACRDLPERSMARVREAFLTSSRYELAFWEMAWTAETWTH